MDIRRITPDYAVGPQIDPADFATLAAEGFKAVINNRPDMEVTPDLSSEAMREAAEAAGLTYTENSVINGGLTMDMVTAQGEAVAAGPGPVFAWCRSGTRSAFVWALSQAGKLPAGELAGKLTAAGYDIPGIAQQIEALERQRFG